MKQIFFFTIALLSNILLSNAQQLAQNKDNSSFFSIQLGAFEEGVKQTDFDAISTYAFIYKRDGLVYAGSYGTEEAAEPVLAKIKAKGFEEAFIVSRSLQKGKPVYVIQIATENAGIPISWANYSRVGLLYTMPNGNQVRIVHGAYEDKNDATAKLKEIIALGFDDAFIRGVKDIQLNALTEFETGDKKILSAIPPIATNVTPQTSTPTPTIEVRSKNVPKGYNNIPSITSKRKSVLKLQDALKELGHYGSVTDGVFTKTTQSNYERALQLNRRLTTYSQLAEKIEGFDNWQDARLLLVMTRDLNINETTKPIVPDLFNNLPTEALSAKNANAVFDWHTALWKKLETWSTANQYNDQIYTALKVTYYRTLIHLEDYFATKGIHGEAGTALGVSVLQTLIVEDFDGFN